MKNYKDKKQARIDRLKNLAEQNQQKSDQAYNEAKKRADVIPLGQPIMIGHHSEKRDRNYRKGINNKFQQSFELSKKADYYNDKALSAENNTAISSDDPEAVNLLKEKLEKLQTKQKFMKDCNRIIRSNKLDAGRKEQLGKLGISDNSISALLSPDRVHGIGFPSYSLTNNNAKIKTVKNRIATLEKQATETTAEKEINGVRVVDNLEDNRLQLFFDGKPSDEIRTQLKRNGFRWSRYNGCWQSYRGNHQKQRAETILSEM